MSDSSSIINLGELSKPVTVLIEKISDAVGGIFKPYQIKRVAKAEAEASLIEVESQIQGDDLRRRAMHRLIEEEARKQANIEKITLDALPLVEGDSSPENVDDDWIANFFDKCRIVSDAQMQQLWSRVLAGEANTPGVFSRYTINLIANIDKDDAEIFTNLCRFVWTLDDGSPRAGERIPLVFDLNDGVYNDNGINFGSLKHLETLGLVHLGDLGFERKITQMPFVLLYHGSRRVELTLPEDANNRLGIGRVIFTLAGHQLASICETQPVPGYFEYVRDRWGKDDLIAGYVAE